MKTRSGSHRRVILALVSALGLTLAGVPLARAVVPFSIGDVFASVGDGKVKHFSPTGSLLETLDSTTASSFNTGMCFDTSGNLYVTNFSADSVSKFNNIGNLVAANYITGIVDAPESCVFDTAGNLFVGTADAPSIHKYSSTGAFISTFTITPDARGADWIDLSADQCTMLYTSEGTKVKRFNVCTNTQLTDFATGLPGPLYALRVLPGGGVLVASTATAIMLNSSGTPTASYTAPGGTTLFALNRDPNGTQFWTGDLDSGNIYKFNITPSAPPVTTFASAPFTLLAGLAVFGELVVGQPTATPTGTVVATATSTPVGGAVSNIPTLSFSMLALLGLALLGTAFFLMRR